ncbi:DUF5994 family protein [Nocardioides daeguensis]|uniref:DUF5994 family protein n=1 Tax=Nocardioides daeguensis TaxID=908359 RepID=UPI0031D75E8F
MDPAPGGEPVRLSMARTLGVNRLDGGWWPRSRNLAVELADLVGQLRAEQPLVRDGIVRARFSTADWDPVPRRVAVAGGWVTAEPLPADDGHLVELTTAGGTALRLLVVPPGFSAGQGAEALLAAATAGNAHAATDLLAVVAETADVDPADRWEDVGGAWWGDDATAPSFRPAPGVGE